jgi:putative nucleotidyltransferase with HDIG domain
MKASNMQNELEDLVQIKSVTSDVKGKRKNSVIINILPLLSMMIAILPGILLKTSGIEIAKVGIFTFLLTGASSFYIRLNADSILNKKLAKTIITLSYLGSILLLLLVPAPETFSFWMFGGLLVAMLIDNKLGLLLHFNLSFILGITLNLHLEVIIHILVIGIMMSLLAGALRQKSTIIYAIIIILSINITLSFVINNFIFDTTVTYNYLNSMFSILALMVSAFFLCIFYDKFNKQNVVNGVFEYLSEGASLEGRNYANSSESQELTTTSVIGSDFLHNTESKEVEPAETFQGYEANWNLSMRTSYELLCDDNNELINKMKQHSEILYAHALHIGDLSYRAAKEIGANDLIAKAGGLYHEVGKINGKNYIEEGLLIAEEYAFPRELKAILKEHNIKYEKPNSVEAAIVMLSDNVVSTIEYIIKTEDHKFTTNKIIDNIFQMRMDKGTFDAANLSLKDFKKLKDFYQREFSKPIA